MADLFIAWAPHNRRSQQLAAALGLELHFIHHLRYRAPLYAPIKYPLMAVETWQLLVQARPSIVFVQNPPPLLPLVVLAFAARHPLRLVVDHHTAAFSRAWVWLGPLRSWIARKAAVNLVTNEHWEGVIRTWGGKTLIMDDVPTRFPEGEPYPLFPGRHIAVISSFAPDEPLGEVLEAARELPGVHFHITGDVSRASARLLQGAPPNVHFTGFLPDEQYFGLLRAVDALVVLTTRDHTNQRGGCEGVWLGKPLVLSDWPALRRAFHGGAIFVRNVAEDIVRGVQEALERWEELRAGIYALQKERQVYWGRVSAYLRDVLEQGHLSHRTFAPGRE